jgi:Holliday junction resolvase-like predicted endonuclease
MAHGSMVIAVEVKTTTNGADPFEAIDDDKMLRMHRAADAYRLPISRVDVIAVMVSVQGATIHWVQSMQ